MRRLASELEALQDNAAEFGSARTGLAGRYVLFSCLVARVFGICGNVVSQHAASKAATRL